MLKYFHYILYLFSTRISTWFFAHGTVAVYKHEETMSPSSHFIIHHCIAGDSTLPFTLSIIFYAVGLVGWKNSEITIHSV